jgi:MSHA biogenesis protein MshI
VVLIKDSQLKKWLLNPKGWFKKKELKPEGVVGLACTEHAVAMSYGVMVDGQIHIKLCEYVSLAPSDQARHVKNWLQRHKLINADCHFVLNEDQYELQLLEAPQVEPSELREAVRWRLKDLISIPIENVVLDIFPLPDDAYRGRMKMIYAVATKKNTIETCLKFITEVGLTPSIIDIQEMALRNIAMYIPEMEFGTVALLNMNENSGAMLMFSHNSLYLTRQIEFGYGSFAAQEGAFILDNDVMLERLSLDLQRSLDYYESQLGKGVTNKIYVLPMEDESVNFNDELRTSLHAPTLHFDCRQFLPLLKSASLSINDQAFCLPVIGAILRQENNAES